MASWPCPSVSWHLLSCQHLGLKLKPADPSLGESRGPRSTDMERTRHALWSSITDGLSHPCFQVLARPQYSRVQVVLGFRPIPAHGFLVFSSASWEWCCKGNLWFLSLQLFEDVRALPRGDRDPVVFVRSQPLLRISEDLSCRRY